MKNSIPINRMSILYVLAFGSIEVFYSVVFTETGFSLWVTAGVLLSCLLGILLGAWKYGSIRTLVVSRMQRLRKAPGLRLMSLVSFFYSPDDVEKTFKPIIADWHKELFEALAARRKWRSRWINVKYRYRFAQAMGLSKVLKLVDTVIKTVTSAFSR